MPEHPDPVVDQLIADKRELERKVAELESRLADVTEHCIGADHDPAVLLNMQRHG